MRCQAWASPASTTSARASTSSSDLAEKDPAKARESVEAMCRQLLANTVIENYAIELVG